MILLVSFAFCEQSANAELSANSTLSLIGTIEGTLVSGAVLQDTAGEQAFYRLYDKLPDGSQVVKVLSDGILLKGADGTAYEMSITRQKKSIAATQPYSASDPSVEAIHNPPAERPLRAYERRRQNRMGNRNSDAE